MKRSGFQVMKKLIGLVRPLSGYMILAVTMGLVGHLCATFITVFGGFAIVAVLKGAATAAIFGTVAVFALVRGGLRYAEQACNHFIAFKLLALIRDKVFGALRRLCPAKLEGKDKGDLISVITSDIELLEVFYAHTISPAVIAALFTVILCVFIGRFHWALGLLALAAYVTVGVVIPLVTSRLSGDAGLRLRMEAGALAGFGAGLYYLSNAAQWIPGDSTALPSEGFDGISVALLASSDPIAAIFSAIFISHISTGGGFMNASLFPPEIADIISGIIIYLCAFSLLFKNLIVTLFTGKHKKRAAKAPDTEKSNGKEAQ